MNVSLSWRSTLFLLFSGAFLITSCKNKDVVPSGPTTNGEVDSWMLENMKINYFWNDKLPANPDTSLSPDQFFLSLLYDRNNSANADRDRFSWAQESAEALKASLGGQSKTVGMQYAYYYRDQSKSTITATVLYVLPGSPAAKAGIKRGDVISKVNGQSLNISNYQSLLSSNADSYTFGFATMVNGVLTDTDQTKQVNAVVFQEDPVLLDTTYTIGGKTIGYVVYNQFIPGLYKADATNQFEDKTYDLKLESIFGKFKQKGVNELVLDLRYNRGGAVSSSTVLASLIGKNIDASKVYYTQKWNSIVTANYDKKYGTGWNTENFLTKSSAIGTNLNRVFILTSGSTASASELVINGLRPFMTVTTIGTTTVGKNVGSITITDNTGRIKWGIQPITFKSANAQGFTDYAGGFKPAVEVKEPYVGMKAFGDLTEPLLGEAIYQISGTRTARRAASTDTDPISLGSSLDQKAGGGNMFVDINPLTNK